MRIDRDHCIDDIAVRVVDDWLDGVAPSAGGDGYDLLNRLAEAGMVLAWEDRPR